MSSACLNDSDEQLVIFRNSDGKVLKSMGPRTAILLKQPWSWFLLNGDGTFRMAIVATHTARMVSIEDD